MSLFLKPLPGKLTLTTDATDTVLQNVSQIGQNLKLPGFTGLLRATFFMQLLLSLISLFSNICLIYFICRYKKGRSTQSIAVVSMSVAHILTAAIVFPTDIFVPFYTSRTEETTLFLCKMSGYISKWNKTVLIYSIFAISLDHYFKVTRPEESSAMAGRCIFFLNFVWFFGAAYNIWTIVLRTSADIIFEESAHSNVTLRMCITTAYFPQLRTGFFVLDCIVLYSLPFLMIGSVFASIIVHSCYFPRDKPKRLRRHVLTVILFLLYFICELPLEIFSVKLNQVYFIGFSKMVLLKCMKMLASVHGVIHVLAYYGTTNALHQYFMRRDSSQRSTVSEVSESFQSNATQMTVRSLYVESNATDSDVAISSM